jgi:xylulokinase
MLHVDGVAAEQEPEDWWGALVGAAGDLFARMPEVRERVAAVCCSTQGEGTICVDRNGRAIGRALTWLDMRGGPAIARRAGGPLRVAGYGPLKLWRWLRLTGGAPALSGKDSAGHIAYIRESEPERYDRTHKFLNVLDYLNLRLTGRFASTRDSILTTWVTDNRGGAVRYEDGLIAQLGVDRDKLPEIVGSTDTVGPLSAEAADALGLRRDVAVIAGAIDNSAVAIGAGAVRDFETHLYLGTSSWLGAHLPFKKTDLVSKIASVPCAIEGRYLATALQSAAGSNLSFFRDRILYHPDELLRDEQRPDVYQALDRIAATVPAGARGLLYMPWLFGERSPVEDANLRAGLVNLSLEHSRADVIRAFLEGVALNTRWMLEPFVRFVGRENAAVTAVGGGAQSDLWCQILSDATGRTVRQPETPIQANAIGAAFIAGVGLGETTFDDVPALIRWRREYAPDRRWRALYDERFACFKDAYRRLAPLYRRLNAPMRTPS